MCRIAVVGEPSLVQIFKSVGFDVLDEIPEEDYDIIFVTENFLCENKESIKNSDKIIIPIPSLGESNGIAMERISKNVIRAVGADIV